MKKIDEKTRLYIALAVNAVVVILDIIGFIQCFKAMPHWYSTFTYYTEESNLFLTVMCIITIVYIVLRLTKKKEMPGLLTLVKYMSVTTVIETFLIVVFVLGFTTPTNELGQSGHVQMLFIGPMLFHHFLCPVLGCTSFVLLEGNKNRTFTFKDTFYALIPTLVYGAITIVLNLLKLMEGPYPFLLLYKNSVLESIIYLILVLGCAYAINVGVYFLYKIINQKQNIQE